MRQSTGSIQADGEVGLIGHHLAPSLAAPAGRLRSKHYDYMFRVPQYKFFGCHLGALYGRYELLDRLQAYKVRPAEDVPPHKFETGTKNHEGLAGTAAAINYLADLGAEFGTPFAHQYPGFEGRRLHLKTAMAAIRTYERPLVGRMIEGLKEIPGVTLYGIADPASFDQRVPTVAFTLEGYTPRQVAERLGDEGIFVWDGNYYALAVTERLGVEERGGMVRVGIAHYNTAAEVDRLLAVVDDLVGL
jgi:selenocysteine lyase/cysteine desulfurase